VPHIRINGYELYYADDSFASPWANPEAVFLQSYMFGNHADWWGWMPTLTATYRVIRLDRRGSGLSQKPDRTWEPRVEDFLSDFVGLLDVLCIDRVNYIGESLGGVLGIAFAALHPERVKTLVLCHTPCRINDAIQSRMRDAGSDGPDLVRQMGSWAFTRSRWLQNHTRVDRSETELLRSLWFAEQRSLMPAHIQSSMMQLAFDPEFSVLEYLPRIKAPTLLISPDQAIATDASEQEMMRSSIPNCKQVTLARDSATEPTWKDPVECAAAAAAFIGANA
jgi:pimeloyl-ACP methyl ester carboxylesterase